VNPTQNRQFTPERNLKFQSPGIGESDTANTTATKDRAGCTGAKIEEHEILAFGMMSANFSSLCGS